MAENGENESIKSIQIVMTIHSEVIHLKFDGEALSKSDFNINITSDVFRKMSDYSFSDRTFQSERINQNNLTF